jgi:hypothetical protein
MPVNFEGPREGAIAAPALGDRFAAVKGSRMKSSFSVCGKAIPQTVVLSQHEPIVMATPLFAGTLVP